MKHHWVLTLLLATLPAGWTLSASARVANGSDQKQSVQTQQYEISDYGLESPASETITMAKPALPDVSQYNRTAVEERLSALPSEPPNISVQRISGISALGDFVDEGRAREWIVRQFSHPQAILVNSGKATLDDVFRQVNDARYLQRNDDGSYLVRLPIAVRPGATLVIRDETLRLSEERGAFIANDSSLFVIDSTVLGWRERDNGPATYQSAASFRPFFVGWGGSKTFVLGSTFSNLGYNQSKSYGFTVAQYSAYDNQKLQREPPSAWLIESVFKDIYYGFYCYEARDVAIVDNVYQDNITYGIDPHDYSSRLLIAGNDVFGTRKKHGIIISRQVNDSWIINNRSHNNALSGIVLDRQSRNNVVAYNVVQDNHGDGIGLYESPDNLLWGNRLVNNLRNGIRIRNSTNVGVYHNIAILNGTFGVLGQVKDLSDTGRNIEEDVYDQEVSMSVVGGKLAANASGPLYTDNPQYIDLYDIEMRFPRSKAGIHFNGVLGTYQTEIFDGLLNQHRAVRIAPVVVN